MEQLVELDTFAYCNIHHGIVSGDENSSVCNGRRSLFLRGCSFQALYIKKNYPELEVELSE